MAETKAINSVAVDADASTESIMRDELDHAGSVASMADLIAGSGAAPAFAIARYDTLQAVSQDWRVLAPLNVEEVYVLVPATSRLRDLGDLRGRRINVGAPGSARATSGESLYRTMFAGTLPAAPLRSASKDRALQALVADEGLDALVFFDGQPSAWLASLPPETRQRLKLLRLDATSEAGRLALRTYLPASVAPALANAGVAVPTLGEVSFLVASPRATRPQQVLQGLCERLPSLKARGHPKWKEVDPSLRLPVSVQPLRELAPTSQACRASTSLNSPNDSFPGDRS